MVQNEIPSKGRNRMNVPLERMKKDARFDTNAFSHKQKNQPLKKSGMNIISEF